MSSSDDDDDIWVLNPDPDDVGDAGDINSVFDDDNPNDNHDDKQRKNNSDVDSDDADDADDVDVDDVDSDDADDAADADDDVDADDTNNNVSASRAAWDNGEDAPNSLRIADVHRVYYAANQVKHLSSRQMFASQNWHLNRVTFFKHWREESQAYAERVKTRKERKERKKKKKMERKARRAERSESRVRNQELDRAHRKDARGFDQLLRQNTTFEKLEERGRGGFCIAPTDVLQADAGNKLSILKVAPKPIPLIKFGVKKSQEVKEILARHDAKRKRGQK